jgi:hypothetical protein
MKLTEQLTEAFVRSPLTVFQLKRASSKALCLYLTSAFIVFGLAALLLLNNQDLIRQALFDYLFPSSWHDNVDQLVSIFFESQAKLVLSSMMLGASLVAASILLFPIKEHYSAAFEKDAVFQNSPVEEFSLIRQALEESKLLILYLTAQMLSLWIGLYPYSWATGLSVTLSMLFLFFFFALDLISPTLQRHKIAYKIIIKVLFKNPFAALGFGLFYSVPLLFLGNAILRFESLSIIEISSIMFLANIVMLALAVPAGTHLASKLLTETRELKPPSKKNIRIVYACIMLTFCVGLFLHSRLALSLHHKSQILKCEYSVVWSTFDINMPSWESLKNGQPVSTIVFDLAIKNPTPFDLSIEENVLSAKQNNQLVGTVDVSGFDVASGETVTKHITINAAMTTQSLSNFTGLLDGWQLNLEFELSPGIPFTVKLLN